MAIKPRNLPRKASVIIQARVGSKRYPKKVLKEINGEPLLEIMIKRVLKCNYVDQIIIATTINKEDDEIIRLCSNLGIRTYRGSENDVLNRYYEASKLASNHTIVRLTGDCPLIDPLIIDSTLLFYFKNNFNFACNNDPPTFPDGFDVEIFSKISLEQASIKAFDKFEREHVTPWIKKNITPNRRGVLKSDIDYSHIRVTVDEPEDFEVITNIVLHFGSKHHISSSDIYELYSSDPDLFLSNKHYVRNEGSVLSTGEKLFRRAKRVIAGGNMLLSKRPDMFLPDGWPNYFSKTSGCLVWDLDDNQYVDTSIMGIGTNTLGYSHPEVDNAVINAAQSGNMSTLNCPEEVFLAEKLIELHPWADQVRFARTGGEANAIAIRIARAASGRDAVAICGYHGWHDWYLSANLSSTSQLNQHLLPGLSPLGVPNALRNTTYPFSYNRIEELEALFSIHKLAAVKMEVQRNSPPSPNFLQSVRELCDENNTILIFDECTSGFRETFGGLHLKYGVMPDIAIFGKALGNGYAITSVIGKQEIMSFVQDTFLSSTFWTERIGPTAALKTLEVMESQKSWIYITEMGKHVKNIWLSIANSHDLPITVSGLDSLASFEFDDLNHLKYKTFLTEFMLSKGYLAGNIFYSCTSHDMNILDQYSNHLDEAFNLISKAKSGELNINNLLQSRVCSSGFKRLN